ncbi:MAG: hypothetical protein LBB40_02425 [Holophagales bacterium]|nr:hypothetical protein [Holophagales bacterium]
MLSRTKKLEIPLGPGIGREGFRFTPAIKGHFHNNRIINDHHLDQMVI